MRQLLERGIWVGVAISVVGLTVIAVGWGRVAALTNVGAQTPYVLSAGMIGLVLVVAGVFVASMSARRQEVARRSEQLRQLAATLEAIRSEVERR